MLEKTKNLFSKVYDIAEQKLDTWLMKARADSFDSFDRYSIDYTEEESETGEAGWRDKKGYVTFDFLKDTANNSIFTAIRLRRINHLASFAHPQKTNKFQPGFRFIMRDKKAQAGDQEDKEIEELTQFLLHTGIEKNRDKITKEPKNFEEFVRLIYRDRLIYNQIGFERVLLKFQDKNNVEKPKIHSFYHAPACSLRYATQKRKDALKNSIQGTDTAKIEELRKKIDSEDIYAVQIYRNKILDVFTQDEMCLKQGNLDAEIDNNGYPQGEFELALSLINAHVFSETHNRLYFTQGFSNKGILTIKKEMSKKNLERFKQQFRQQMQGTANAFRVPILTGTEVQWVQLQPNLKDMEWKEWMYYLIRIICSFFQMSPSEINFDISKEGTSLVGGDSGARNEVIFSYFKETGIRPLLRWLEDIINKEIIRYYNEEYYKKYVFEFVGIDPNGEQKELEKHIKEVQYYKTVNEIRAAHDLEDLPDGDIILNSVFIQAKQAEQQGMGSPFDGMDIGEEEGSVEGNENLNPIMERDTETAEKALKEVILKKSRPALLKVEWYRK